MTWDNVTNKISKMMERQTSRRSEKKSLLKIIAFAEANGIDPDYADLASVSNLSEIIPESKMCMKWNNVHRLEELFMLAAKLNNRDLRLELQRANPEIIKVMKGGERDDGFYLIRVTREQLEKIQKSMKLQYTFHIEEHH